MKAVIGFLFLSMLALTIAGQFGPEEAALYKPVGECPKVDGEFPVLLPDSSDKTIFYKCFRGIPHKMKCPPKTEFNPVLKVCDHPNP